MIYAVIQWLKSGAVKDLKRAADYAIENADYVDEYSGEREHEYEVVDPNRVPNRPLAVQERARQTRDAKNLLDDRVPIADRAALLRKRRAESERVDVLATVVH